MSEAIAWAFVLLAIADIGATVSLVRAARKEQVAALTERAIASILLTLAASCIAVLSIAFLVHVKLPVDIATVVFVGALVLISVPQLIWYGLYKSGRFS